MTVKTFFAKDLYIHFDWTRNDGSDGYYTVVYSPQDPANQDLTFSSAARITKAKGCESFRSSFTSTKDAMNLTWTAGFMIGILLKLIPKLQGYAKRFRTRHK